MNNFVEVTEDWRERDGEERHVRMLDDKCWISVLYRLTGFGYREWETALVFVPDAETSANPREVLIIGGDWRHELNGMPKEQLRDWYARNIDGNRNSMDTLLNAVRGAT